MTANFYDGVFRCFSSANLTAETKRWTISLSFNTRNGSASLVVSHPLKPSPMRPVLPALFSFQ